MNKLRWPIDGIGIKPGISITQWFGNPGIVYQDTYYGGKLVKAGQSLYELLGMKGHNGIDIGCPVGTPIKASHDGQLILVPDAGGYGNYCMVTDSERGTIYGHLSKFEGQARQVKEGDIIAYSGNTGYSTGPHLHWGFWFFSTPKDNGFLGYTDQYPLSKIRAFLTGYRKHPEKDFTFRLDSMDRLDWFLDQAPALESVFQIEDSEVTLPLDKPPFPIP